MSAITRLTLTLSLTICVLAFAPACTKPDPEVDPEIEVLEKKLQSLQKDLQTLEIEIGNSESDPALKAKLEEDQKLTESRKDRLDFELQKRRPTPAPSSGGHGAPPAGH